jgi:hypothetical protein
VCIVVIIQSSSTKACSSNSCLNFGVMVKPSHATLTSDVKEDPQHDGCSGQTDHKEDTDHGTGIVEEPTVL